MAYKRGALVLLLLIIRNIILLRNSYLLLSERNYLFKSHRIAIKKA